MASLSGNTSVLREWDSSEWALETPKKKVPYKMLSMELDYEQVRGSGSVDVLILAEDLEDFANEMLPPPKAYGKLRIPQFKEWVNSSLAVQRLSIKRFSDDKPIDPFTDDPDAPEDTYHPVVMVTLSLGVRPTGYPDPDRPITFLEIAGESTGEFIHSPPIDMEIEEVDKDGNVVAGVDAVKVRIPVVPHTVLCPETTWTLVWRSIPFTNYRKIVVPRLENALGTVNSKSFEVMHVAPKETLLFLGYSYQESYTWRRSFNKKGDTPDDESLVDLTMKMLDKRIVWKGELHGHQSQWIPGKGWKRVKIGGELTFDSTDFNDIFKT